MESEFDKLEQIFDQIPFIQGFKPVFEYGSHEDLLRFLSMKRKEGVSYYPLIWMVTPVTFSKNNDNNNRKSFTDITVILATLSTQDLSNKERSKITLKQTLVPLRDYVLHSLKTNLATALEDEYKETVYFNYDTNSEKGASDIWDAMKLDLSTYFKDNCEVNNTKF